MSVIVNGMEMPKSCANCKFSYEIVDDWHCMVEEEPDDAVEGGMFWKLAKNGGVLRPDWCPLRPLPEKHGRLIDAGALDETFSRHNDDGWQLTRGDHKRMESVLFEMPTIVEAEG